MSEATADGYGGDFEEALSQPDRRLQTGEGRRELCAYCGVEQAGTSLLRSRARDYEVTPSRCSASRRILTFR